MREERENKRRGREKQNRPSLFSVLSLRSLSFENCPDRPNSKLSLWAPILPSQRCTQSVSLKCMDSQGESGEV